MTRDPVCILMFLRRILQANNDEEKAYKTKKKTQQLRMHLSRGFRIQPDRSSKVNAQSNHVDWPYSNAVTDASSKL